MPSSSGHKNDLVIGFNCSGWLTLIRSSTASPHLSTACRLVTSRQDTEPRYGQYPLSWIITPTETSTGAIKVFQMAKQKAGGLAPLIHTDRGAAYTSKAFNHYLASNNSQHSYSAPGTPADNAVMEHWWADFKSIWLAHSPQPQTFEDLEQLVTEGIDYFTHSFISGKRNDLTAAEYRFGKAN